MAQEPTSVPFVIIHISTMFNNYDLLPDGTGNTGSKTIALLQRMLSATTKSLELAIITSPPLFTLKN